MQTWRIVYKDLSVLLRDRIALLLLLGMPLSLTAIIGFSTNQLLSNLYREKITLLVLDQDGGEAAQQFIQSLTENKRFQLQRVDSQKIAESLIRNRDRTVGLVIGPRFGERIDSLELNDFLNLPKGRLAKGLDDYDIEVISRERIVNVGQVLTSQMVLWKVVEVAYERMLERFTLVRAFVEANPTKASEDGFGGDSDWSGTNFSKGGIYRFLVPSQAVLFTFFLVSIMAQSFMTERERGTLQRLRMAPLSGPKLILGKTIPFLLVSVTQGTLLFSAGWAVFGMPVGQQPGILLLVIICTSLAATTLGLLVSVSVRTNHQVTVVGTFLILGMAGLSGCLMPRTWLPPLLKQLSLVVTPHAWALAACRT